MRSTSARRPDVRGAVTFARTRWTLALSAAVALSIAAAPYLPSASPVADAEQRGDSAAVRDLLRHGADVNAAQGDGMTALHWAAMHDDAAQAKMLVYAGARL